MMINSMDSVDGLSAEEIKAELMAEIDKIKKELGSEPKNRELASIYNEIANSIYYLRRSVIMEDYNDNNSLAFKIDRLRRKIYDYKTKKEYFDKLTMEAILKRRKLIDHFGFLDTKIFYLMKNINNKSLLDRLTKKKEQVSYIIRKLIGLNLEFSKDIEGDHDLILALEAEYNKINSEISDIYRSLFSVGEDFSDLVIDDLKSAAEKQNVEKEKMAKVDNIETPEKYNQISEYDMPDNNEAKKI